MEKENRELYKRISTLNTRLRSIYDKVKVVATEYPHNAPCPHGEKAEYNDCLIRTDSFECWGCPGFSKKLYVSDPDRRISRSEKTDNFANEIIPDINLCDPDKAEIYVASISQVKMLESRLRDVGYELKDGQMKKIDGNKE